MHKFVLNSRAKADYFFDGNLLFLKIGIQWNKLQVNVLIINKIMQNYTLCVCIYI